MNHEPTIDGWFYVWVELHTVRESVVQQPIQPGWELLPSDTMAVNVSRWQGRRWRHQERRLLVTVFNKIVCVHGSAHQTLGDIAFAGSSFGMDNPLPVWGPKITYTLKENT